MTASEPTTVYRYVSDGQMEIAINRDAMARISRPLLWVAITLFGFTFGFLLYADRNRESLPYYRSEVLRNALFNGLVSMAVVVIAVPLVIPLTQAINRRRMRRLFPVGSVTEIELSEDALVLRRPPGTRSIPYQEIRRVRVGEHLNWVMTHRRPLVEVLPTDLLPPDGFEYIRTRAAGGVPLASFPPPIGPTRELVLPTGWAPHVATAAVWASLRAPRFWLRFGSILLLSALIAAVAGRIWLLLGPAAVITLMTASYRLTRESIAHSQPSGSVVSSEFFEDRFVCRNARWGREIRFDEIRRVDVRGDVVLLGLTPSANLAIARALFPDDVLERLTSGSMRRA